MHHGFSLFRGREEWGGTSNDGANRAGEGQNRKKEKT